MRSFQDRARSRRAMTAGASAIALMVCSAPALAQDEDEEEAAETAQRDDAIITVTGSRIAANVGMRAPTPVTAVSDTELDALSPSTLISAISQLPQFYGNTNSDVRTGFFGSPGSGNLNLRGLNTGGSGRTLTLLDGRRVVPATGFGSVDINILPSALIQRVETVTGGASAAYGTDAVAGAVNFVLNTKYTGWEVTAQGGITSRGDRENVQVSATWGAPLLAGRAHLLLSGEYHQAVLVANLTDRDWYEGWSLINNPAATTANPYETRLLRVPNAVSAIATFGGLIHSCTALPPATPPGAPPACTSSSGVRQSSALWRQHFQPNGTLAPFVLGLGQGGEFQPFSAHSIANGGSGDDTTGNLLALSPKSQRSSGFAYLGFDATPSLNLYLQGLIGQSMVDQPDHGGRFAAVSGLDTRITIFRENAFLPQAVRQIMIDEGLQSFQMNVVGDREGLGRESRLKQDNLTYSGTAGFTWEIPNGVLGGWQVEGYAQYGSADNRGYQQGILIDRVVAAVDAVVDPATGQVVCRAALIDPATWGGCVPLNLFGRGNASDAAIAYVTRFTPGQQITTPLFFQPDGFASGKTATFTTGLGKVYNTSTEQYLADISMSGEVWKGWAGPIVAAFGGSYRKEKIEQIVYDPSNPSSDPNFFPASAANAPALRGVPGNIATRSSMIQNSTVANVHGSYDVKEAFAELQVPLLSDFPLVEQLNLLAAARYADYSGSGGVWSWKAGLDWQVFGDLRLRGTVSRDLRAATLLERFNQTGGVGSVATDKAFPNETLPHQFSSRTGGNPDLSPETSTTYTYGLVYQPSWLPGFSTSVDYWDVDIAGAIGLLGFQRIVDDCFDAPGSAICSLVTRDPTTNRLLQVRNITQNIAAAAGRGFDVEASYRTALDLLGGDGESLSARVFWSHLIENSTMTDRSRPATYFDAAGQTGVANLPRDAVTGIQSYTNGGFNLSLTERFISKGIYNKRFNQPGARPDVADNTVPSVIYVNLSASYTWDTLGGSMQLFGNVQNLFDKDPPIVAGVFDTTLGQTGNQFNAGLFDLLGRRFTVGVKFKR
jgi:iron complex outermembrane recepter protein